MRSVLDDHGDRWFVTSLVYEPPRLVLTLSQAVRGAELPVLNGPDGPIPTPGRRRLEASSESRAVEVTFQEVVAYQVLDEMFTRSNERETPDDPRHVIQVLNDSPFLERLPGELFAPPWNCAERRLFRVCTLGAVVDVVGRGAPQVRPSCGT